MDGSPLRRRILKWLNHPSKLVLTLPTSEGLQAESTPPGIKWMAERDLNSGPWDPKPATLTIKPTPGIIGNNEWSQIQANPWEPASECKRPETTTKICISTGQWPQTYSQNNTGMASEQNVKVIEWPSQSSDLNRIENLWKELKIAVHWRSPSNLAELEQICKEEWEKISKSRCAKLIDIPKKTWSCNYCQRNFYSVESGGWILIDSRYFSF